MKILAIETSCDETAIALVEASGNPLSKSRSASWRIQVLKNLVASQIKTHRPYGGVVPMLAKREHLKNLPVLWRQIANRKSQIDTIAVTVGPGLDPCLWTGIEFAQKIAKEVGRPLLGVNHLEGHLYSNWLPPKSKLPITNFSRRKVGTPTSLLKDDNSASGQLPKFPAIALIVSGGHTILLYMSSLTKWKKLGETRDDAAGEAFDKVARLLGLPYPGGPEIEKLARKGDSKAINFPRPMLAPRRSFLGIDQKNPVNPALAGHGASYDFSFSGLKTAVLYYLRDNPRVNKADVAASFQEAVVDVLVKKTMRAAQAFGAKAVLLCGGVAANKALRKSLALSAKRLAISFHVPPFDYNTDNAAMIAAAAYIKHLQKKPIRQAQGREIKLIAQPNLNF